jgi:excinuclease ABC subunit A
VIEELREKYRRARAPFVRGYYEKFMRRGPCPDCGGARLNEQALGVRLFLKGRGTQGLNIRELCAMSVGEAQRTLERLSLSPVQQVIAEEVLKEVRARLTFLLDVGLHYLTLDRTAPTLSGGELQRIRLAAQIGSGLAGVLYILDEPSIGLHARDNRLLLDSLEQLRDMGNTVIVVEHDEATMRRADHIVDFGPGPGVRGGEVVASGSLADIVRTEASLTGCYLRGDEEISVPNRRPVKKRRNVETSRSQKVGDLKSRRRGDDDPA